MIVSDPYICSTYIPVYIVKQSISPGLFEGSVAFGKLLNKKGDTVKLELSAQTHLFPS